ncbi:MAG: PD-(D/E)XK nuclease family transposase [Bacteroidetes bacterium]|uniref:PD-(D/E)XK nuclease family transposase n=1 Tax=Candidatus Pullibacteroides excrementavium TaxID=2840905 RepID=A0A9D9DTG3_9BACT|nr:PD-(D/E)XK nuclease family transposase [Candidatus Pullibacteroides excrementavium]
MEKKTENYIRFDWAMKRLLRNKANFDVLEGFLSSLFGKTVKIQGLLESEGNRERENDKANRVDLLALMDTKEKVIIEVQNNTETAYFQRMIFGTSKVLCDYINKGDNYEHVSKVYSVNIVYFALGKGTDYVYHGKTEFRGIHNGDILELNPFQKEKFEVDTVSQLFPEYYILKVNDFDKVAKSPIEEWIYYFKTGTLPENASAPGLDKVRELLRIDRMSEADRNAYYQHLDDMARLHDTVTSGYEEGRFEGRLAGMAEGRAEGRAQGRAEGRAEGLAEGLAEGRREGLEEGMAKGKQEEKILNARNLKQLGISLDIIAKATGLSPKEINAL